jgi:hypothetical protein
LPTSSLVAANFNPRHHSNSKPRRCVIYAPSPWWPQCAWCCCCQMNFSPRSSSTPSRMWSFPFSEPSQ